jgi:hypothetical protein
VKIVVVEEELEEGSAVVTGVVRAGIGPLPSNGLDETFGLAIGLGPVGTGEAMLEAELAAGLGEEPGAISGTAVGEDTLDADAMSLVEVDGLLESGQDTGSFFIREERSESQTGMIIDGDVEGLDAGARITVGAIAGGADAGLVKTAQFLDIQMKELARSGPLVANRRRPGRVEGGQAVETMAAQDAGKGGLGDRQSHEDLSVRAALSAQGQDLIFQERRSLTRLAKGNGGAIVEALREVGLAGAFEPFADGLFRDRESGGGSTERAARGEMLVDQFSSHERGESGISVHVDREV